MTVADEELDRALQALRTAMVAAHDDADAPPVEDVLTAARAQVATGGGGAGGSGTGDAGSRTRRRVLVAAAALVLVAAGMLVALPGTGPSTASAAAVLERAAIGATDPPLLQAGQYRYVETHAWYLHTSALRDRTFSALEESRYQVWAPQDPAQDWQLVRGDTGARHWIVGTEQEARAAGIPLGPPALPTRITAPCGAFYGPPSDVCHGPGSWQVPTSAFLAGLPRDPSRLLARLRADAPHTSRGSAELLVYVTDLLRGPLPVPADLRSALYRALTRIDGLTLTPGTANLDGRSGTALGIDDSSSRTEIIVDPATGEFIGEREIALHDYQDRPAGTVTGYTSVRSAVVDAIGAAPAG